MRARRALFGVTVLAAMSLAVDAGAFDWEPQVPQEPAPPSGEAPTPAPTPSASEEGPPAPPLPHVDFEVGAQAGYLSPPIRGGTNPFGAGLGGRFGLVWSDVYLGVSVMDYLGGTDVDVSYRAIQYGLEVGYGFRWRTLGDAQLVLRPLVGIGATEVDYKDPTLAQQVDVVTNASTGRSTASRGSTSDTIAVDNLYVQPALTAMIAHRALFAGATASVLLLPGISYGGAEPTTWISYGLQGQAGVRF